MQEKALLLINYHSCPPKEQELIIVKGLVRDDNTGQKWREVHRTMSLVQQTPLYGVRCGRPAQ
jgi:hypothetical protein